MRRHGTFKTSTSIGAVALMAVLTACGGSANAPVAQDDASETVAANDQDVETTTTTEAPVDEGSAADSIWDEYESPIQKFLGFENQDYSSEEFQAQAQAEERTIQEAVVKCMAELGWEYKPEDTASFSSFDENLGGVDYGSREWVETYGFGISTQAFSQEEVGPNLVGYNFEEFSGEEDNYVDPNQGYVESLDEAAREAYFADLYGAEPDIDWETATEEEINEAYENWEPDGCQNQAYENSELFGGGGAQIDFYESFSDELDSLYESVESDPRLAALNKEVEDCVAAKGLTYRGDDVWEYFSELMNPIQEEVWGSPGDIVDPFGDVDFEAMTPEEQEAFQKEVEEFYNQARELSDEIKAKLADIQKEEIELAVAMEDCGRSQRGNSDYDKVFIEVLAEYEQDFLDRNAGALADFEGSAGN